MTWCPQCCRYSRRLQKMLKHTWDLLDLLHEDPAFQKPEPALNFTFVSFREDSEVMLLAHVCLQSPPLLSWSRQNSGIISEKVSCLQPLSPMWRLFVELSVHGRISIGRIRKSKQCVSKRPGDGRRWYFPCHVYQADCPSDKIKQSNSPYNFTIVPL